MAHYIVVGEIDPETNAPEWDIEHQEDCELVDVSDDPKHPIMVYQCVVGRDICDEGIDAFGWMRKDMNNNWPSEFPTDPGKYEIEAWGEKYWTDYGWEYDGGLRLVTPPLN